MKYGQGNRGMGLETLLDMSNTVYRNRGQALITKRPTPVVIERKLAGGKISGRLEKASTVDYEGVYRGRSIQFEAKSTKVKTRFDLDNIHDHQVNHMRQAAKCGAIVFLVIEFTTRKETFFVPAEVVVDAFEKWKWGAGAASISYDKINEWSIRLKPTNGVPLDFLAVVDDLIGDEAA